MNACSSFSEDLATEMALTYVNGRERSVHHNLNRMIHCGVPRGQYQVLVLLPGEGPVICVEAKSQAFCGALGQKKSMGYGWFCGEQPHTRA